MMDLVYRNKKSDRIIKPEKEFYVGMKKKDFTDHELDRLQLLRRSRSPEPIVRVDMGLQTMFSEECDLDSEPENNQSTEKTTDCEQIEEELVE